MQVPVKAKERAVRHSLPGSPLEKEAILNRDTRMQSGVERETGGGFSFHNPAAARKEEGENSCGSIAIFDRVRAQLKARLGSEVYSSWFGRMKLAETSKGVVRISVPTAFLRTWINGHYLDLITELWKKEEPTVLKVEIVVRTATHSMPVRA